VRVSDVTRTFFARSAAQFEGQTRADMERMGSGSADPAAIGRIAAANPLWNAMLRTTCVPTMVQAGHAPNALPQRAEANINCRILPGETVEAVRNQLQSVVGDPALELALADAPGPVSPPPRLTEAVIGPVERLVAEMWPGVPVVPSVGTGATDGRFLNAGGIPTYGISGMFVDPDGNGVHGLNERIGVKSLHEGRDFLYRLIKIYAAQRR
jgi:acetylornithine deacetylase/succinyl-diaminopimelate desuccinylase-like protein